MRPSVDIVIPVLNEAHVIEGSIAKVREHLKNFPYRWRIVIVDNGSTDGTADAARRICREDGSVTLQILAVAGRGRALRHAWLQSEADAVCYMDVDLSTDLTYLEPLVRAVVDEGYDIATGSRLLAGSRTSRSFTRQVISRCYNWVVRFALSTRFSDAQCGFKALRRPAVEAVVPQVQDQSWFFDTELLTLAEKQGLRIADIPVRWVEDDDSRVRILRTAWDDLKGIWRVRRQLRAKAARSVESAQESH